MSGERTRDGEGREEAGRRADAPGRYGAPVGGGRGAGVLGEGGSGAPAAHTDCRAGADARAGRAPPDGDDDYEEEAGLLP